MVVNVLLYARAVIITNEKRVANKITCYRMLTVPCGCVRAKCTYM